MAHADQRDNNMSQNTLKINEDAQQIVHTRDTKPWILQ